MYGFTPSATVTLTIASAQSKKTVTLNQYWWYETFLGATWPQETYTITAAAGATMVTTAVAETSSLPVAGALGYPGARTETMPDLMPEFLTE